MGTKTNARRVEGLPKDTALQFREELRAAKGALIGAHLNPDGDTLGSALALSHYLDTLGLSNEVLCHHPPPDNLRFLPGVERVRQEPKETGHDLAILVDLDSTERLGSTGPFFESLKRTIVIDHHVPHVAPGDLRIIDENAPATAVLLCRLFDLLDVEPTPEIATCLLTGIVTDTGSFRFRNTTPEALTLAASLIEQGADISRISVEVYHRKPLSSLRLLGLLLEKMEIDCGGRLAWGVLTSEQFATTGAADEDTEGFVNELLSVRSVQVAALFRSPKPGKVRVSLRSMGDHDVAEIAREFGGGGHKNAAGMSFDAEIGEVVRSVVPRLKRCWASS